MTATEQGRASAQHPVVIGEIDFTVILLAHDAFTRDLRRLIEACLLGRAWTRPAATTWSTVARQLGIHRRVEAEMLWPQVRSSAPPYRAAIGELATERAHIEPVLTTVETVYRAGRVIELYDALNDLGRRLGAYMCHYEQLAFPLIACRLPPPNWAAFTARLRQSQGRRGATEYLPWLLDGTTGPMSKGLFASQPATTRALHQLLWSPRYRRSHLGDLRP